MSKIVFPADTPDKVLIVGKRFVSGECNVSEGDACVSVDRHRLLAELVAASEPNTPTTDFPYADDVNIKPERSK